MVEGLPYTLCRQNMQTIEGASSKGIVLKVQVRFPAAVGALFNPSAAAGTRSNIEEAAAVWSPTNGYQYITPINKVIQ